MPAQRCTLALSFAAQNAVTALRMDAGWPLPDGQPTEPAAGRGMVTLPELTAHERIQARRLEPRERREAQGWG